MLYRFPLEVALDGKRYKIVYTTKQLSEFIDNFSGTNNLYTSLFSFENIENGKADYGSAIIDRSLFDLDLKNEDFKEEFIIEAKKLIDWLNKKRFIFTINFSGKGLHIVVFIKPEFIFNKKVALRNFQLKVVKEAKLTLIGKEHPFWGYDSVVFGDIARIVRLVHSRNSKSGLFVVPVKQEELNYEKLKKLSENRRNTTEEFIYGKYLASIKEFDSEFIQQKVEVLHNGNDSFVIDYEKLEKKFSDIKCIAEAFDNNWAGYEERNLMLSYLKNSGYTENEAYGILHHYISKEKFVKSDCAEVHTSKFYARPYLFPSCALILSKGLCPFGDKQRECPYFGEMFR
jgi:hypothetical protein